MTTSETITLPTPRDAEFWLAVYRRMATIRHFEERVDELYRAAIMPGLAHLSIGQEGTEVGICDGAPGRRLHYKHASRPRALPRKGRPARPHVRRAAGERGGLLPGKGGSMHIADQERNNLGANAIVGGSAGIATGAALSAKMRGTDQIAVCFFGEGALGQGLLYESMNMASIWKLPVIYVCENNQYSEYTPYGETTSGEVVGSAGGIRHPCEQIDGQDVRTVHEVATRLVAEVRGGGGPRFLEAKTYRYRGHHVGDVDRRYYRSRDEEDEWARDRDPLRKLADWLIAEELADEETFELIHKDVGGEIEAAAQFAIDAPFPDPSEVDKHVYA